MNIRFFENSLENAIGAGIYEIYILKNGKEELIYIGESVFVLVRCATYLYEMKKGEGYLGFTKDMLDRADLTVVFKLLMNENDRRTRQTKESELVKKSIPECNPVFMPLVLDGRAATIMSPNYFTALINSL